MNSSTKEEKWSSNIEDVEIDNYAMAEEDGWFTIDDKEKLKEEEKKKLESIGDIATDEKEIKKNEIEMLERKLKFFMENMKETEVKMVLGDNIDIDIEERKKDDE